jgi:hypothetical protein
MKLAHARFILRDLNIAPPTPSLSQPVTVGEIEDSSSRYAMPPRKFSFRTAGYESTRGVNDLKCADNRAVESYLCLPTRTCEALCTLASEVLVRN